jgi:MFS family permease
VAGRVYLRVGFRWTAIGGSVVVVWGTVLCALLGAHPDVWEVAFACFVVGVGLGFCNPPVLVAIQSVVGWDRRGVVTGANLFSRAIGSALGVAVLGAVANASIHHGIAHATHLVFVVLVGVALALTGSLLLLPRRVRPLSFDEPNASADLSAGPAQG